MIKLLKLNQLIFLKHTIFRKELKKIKDEYMRSIKYIIILCIIAIGSFQSLYSQQAYSLNNEESRLQVKGTSSLHDWDMLARKMEGTLQTELNQKTIQDITSASVYIEATSLKSGKSGLDSRAYKALKTDSYSAIIFRLKGLEKIGGDLYQIRGDLTIAGTTRVIQFEVESSRMNEDKLRFNGKTSLKMTHFNIEPPSLMFGSVKAGDQVNISFSVVFDK